MGKRVRTFDYLGLHDEEFEELTFLVAHLEEPTAVRPASPDLGLDVVVPGSSDHTTTRGFQAKHFTGAPSWAQCRRSLDNAVEHYAPVRVTFTFPRDLTGKQLKKFHEELANRHAGVVVDHWGASQLTAKLLSSDAGERIARYVFGADQFERMSRLIRAGHDLDDAAQAVSALGAISDRFADDPYYAYAVGSRPASLDAAPPADGTMIRVEMVDEHGAHVIDAMPKAGALAGDRLPSGHLEIAGRDAVERFQQFLRVGGELELHQIGMRWHNRPKYLEELLPDAEKTQAVLSAPLALPPRPMRIELDTTTGQTSTEFDMHPTAPPKDGSTRSSPTAAGRHFR